MKLTKISKKGKLGLALAAIVLIVGLYSFVRPNLAAREKVTGMELFEGIFFLRGDVAWQLPVLKTLNKHSTNEMSPLIKLATNERQNEVINYLAQKDKTFFTRFQSEMTSGDAFRISETLTKAGDLLKEALNEMPQLRHSSVSNSKGIQIHGSAVDTYCDVLVFNSCDIDINLIDDNDNDIEGSRQEAFTRELLVKQIIENF